MSSGTTRLRCDPTDYAKKQQEKKDLAKQLREQRQRGVFVEEHTFAPKVNPRNTADAPSSREEDERPSATMRRTSTTSQKPSFEDMPIRPSNKARKEEEVTPSRTVAPTKRASVQNGSNRGSNNDRDGYGDSDQDALDNLSRKFPKKVASRQPAASSPSYSPKPLEPEDDSLFREVKRTTGYDIDDIPIKKLNSAAAAEKGKHVGPCLRNSSCGCPKCGGGGTVASNSSRPVPDQPIRRRETRPEPVDEDVYSKPMPRSSNSDKNEMENSLTLLKSKMERQKARSAPSNQASLYYEKPSIPEPTSARESGYASSTSTGSNIPSRRISQAGGTSVRSSQAPPPQTQQVQPTQARGKQPPVQTNSRKDREDRPLPAANRKLGRHQEEEEEDLEPPSKPKPISSGFKEGEEPSEYAEEQEDMEECHNCHRRFNVVSLQKHTKYCEKVFSGHRKVYNMAAKRLEGTEAEKIAKEASKKGGKGGKKGAEEAPIRAKAADWKQQSNAFRDAMRANRDINAAVKEGRPLPPMAPSAPDSSLIQCDHCGRRFNDKAADRHIAFCKEKSQRDNVSKGPPKKPAAKPIATRGAPPAKKR